MSKKSIGLANEDEVDVKVNQLRDPVIFEEDEQLYLLYTSGGEQGIEIVELKVGKGFALGTG